MTTTIIEALSGLGMFLFGMFYMELSLKEAAGVRFKGWVKNSTSNTAKSLMTGMLATTALQSSSVVTLMTLSFVSASLITLQSGIAVIFGSNVGTTATAWIVATLGFKVKIEAFALPMIGMGGLILMLAGSNRKAANIAKIAVGFGLLFLGLDIMKTAIESFAEQIDLSHFSTYPPIAFVGIGFVLTALIQSSSAATAIVLSALFAHILTFESAAAMIIGTNIGTTVTALLGAIGGIPDKKRAAAAHLIFNIITAIVAFMLLGFLTSFLMNTLNMKNDPTMALALFHTIFNVLGVLLLTPFIPLLSRTLKRYFSQKKSVATRYIHLVDPHVPDGAFVALRNEVNNLFVKTMKFALLLSHIKPNDLFVKKYSYKELVDANTTPIEFDHKKAYDAIKEIEVAIMEFVAILNQQNLTPEQGTSMETLVSSMRESVYAAKILKDIKNNINEFSESDNETIKHIYRDIRRNQAYAMSIFANYMDGSWTIEKCEEKFHSALEENQRIMREATMAITQPTINEKHVVSLLNTNRSVYTATEALMGASKIIDVHFSIDKDDAEIS